MNPRCPGLPGCPFRQVIEQMSTGALVVQDGRVVFANAALARLLGRSAEGLFDSDGSDLLDEGERQALLARHRRRVAGSGGPERYRLPLRRGDGSPAVFEVEACRIDWQGRPASLALVFDASAIAADESAMLRLLVASATCAGSELYRLVAEGAAGLFPDGKVQVLATGDGAPRLLAEAGAATGGLLPAGLAQIADRAAGQGLLVLHGADAVLGDGALPDAHGLAVVTATSRDGRTLGLLLVLTPGPLALPPRSEPLLRVLAGRVAMEIEREAAEATLRAREAAALRDDRLRSLGEMAGGMAHEFNQPLTIIRTSVEGALIARRRNWELSPAKLDEKLELVIGQVDRLSRLIDHVREFAREAGSVATRRTDLGAVVDAALSLCRSQLEARGVKIAWQRPAAAVGAIANPHALEDCLLAVLRNARDAIQAAGRPGTVTISLTDDPPAIVIEDDGPGLAPDALQRLFQPFFTTRDVGQGTGLGLALARRSMAAMDGDIEVVNRAGGGVRARLICRRSGGDA